MHNEKTLKCPILAVIGPDVIPDLSGQITVGQYKEPTDAGLSLKIGLRIGLNTLFEATLTAAQMRGLVKFITALLRGKASFPDGRGDYAEFTELKTT